MDTENEFILRGKTDKFVHLQPGFVLAPKYIDGCDGSLVSIAALSSGDPKFESQPWQTDFWGRK